MDKSEFGKHHKYIASLQNERAKLWSSLLEKKHRDRQKRFLVEGIHLIVEAAKYGAAVETVVYDEERGVPAELAEVQDHLNGTEWMSASRAVMAKCTGTDSPPPVFAVVVKPGWSGETIYRSNGLVVVLDNVRDPGNVGTIIRSADAVGADAVILGKGCADLYNPKTVRSTMGSLFHLPVVEGDLLQLMPEARARGLRLVGTSPQASHNCYQYDWKQGIWLVMGNEADGVSEAVEALLDDRLIIPMKGKAESLNVAMASTVLLYEALRQRTF
ncbi:RNA methyltransferase [Paenibacillus sp. J5C_2022]|uniref:TrmH family RNA methyltransferase n=1 Tax=Paenibacillus sp. J5C2022 TaxID=2977129 RepID=UPI0021CF9DFB|nr:RNA methyltransferase [Paenibacillus sp. J5C2022]MCU6711980.1 RNA methyltransferase [Paenibacillus sp. J5C2022]